MPSDQGRAELRAGAGVVAIGVGSPVARPGADGRRRREARAAVGAVCAVDAVCVSAPAAVVAEGVGGVETRPLARPPKGTQKKSLGAAVACDDGGVERRQCRGARQLASCLEAFWSGGGRTVAMVTARARVPAMACVGAPAAGRGARPRRDLLRLHRAHHRPRASRGLAPRTRGPKNP
jgi:hypothetical protein